MFADELINKNDEFILDLHLCMKKWWKEAIKRNLAMNEYTHCMLRVCRNWIKFSSQQALEILTHVESLVSTLYSSAFDTWANLLRFLCFALL